jgi:uncharacterized membrane protein YhaH (DUF805 family)
MVLRSHRVLLHAWTSQAAPVAAPTPYIFLRPLLGALTRMRTTAAVDLALKYGDSAFKCATRAILGRIKCTVTVIPVLLLALTSQFVWLLSLWPILAVGAKRLHDRSKNGWWLLVFWLLPVALVVGGFSIALFDDPRTGRSGDFSTGAILIFASLLPALWGIVELGILPGTRGPNLYGADPAQQPA